MGFSQRAMVCSEHEGCTVIVGVSDGTEVWWSHMPDDVAPEVRLNVDYPSCDDHRGQGRGPLSWRLATIDEADRMGWGQDGRRRAGFAAAMSKSNAATLEGVAAELGVDAAALVAEAVDSGWSGLDEAAAARAANVSPQQVAAARAARRAAGK